MPLSQQPPLPTSVQIEPVGQCNLRCQMCPIQFRTDGPPQGPPAFMAFETFTALVDQFPRLKSLHLQGLGEPMMHPRFFDMVRYAVNRGARVTTNSNLTLLNERKAEYCVTSGLECVHVSVDGATPETYEHIRVRGHFARVERNVRLLMDARQRSGGNSPRMHLVMVVMRQNIHELPDIVRMANDWGMDEVFVQHLCHDFGESSLPASYRPMREFVEDQTLLNDDPDRVRGHFEAARCAAEEVGMPLRLPRTTLRLHRPSTPGRERCEWPWTAAYFSYDGRSMPCCMVSTPDRINFGDASGGSFARIWDGEEYSAFRERLASPQPPDICASCSVYRGVF